MNINLIFVIDIRTDLREITHIIRVTQFQFIKMWMKTQTILKTFIIKLIFAKQIIQVVYFLLLVII